MSSSEDDTQHLADCIYEVKSATVSDKPKSNRILPEEHKRFDYKNVKVSDAYRSHVSKHLESLLESTSFVKIKKKEKKKDKKKPKKSVVTLLSSSKKALVVDVSVSAPAPTQRKVQSKWLSDEELESRARQVAQSGEYILSKAETKAWAPETKGTLEIVKSVL